MTSLERGFALMAQAFRYFGERFVVIALIFAAAALLVLGKADIRAVRAMGDTVAGLAVPLQQVINQPWIATERLAAAIGNILAVHDENARLRAENERLLEWQAEAVYLAVENRALRTALEMPEPRLAEALLTARIVADSSSSFFHARLIEAGRDHGIAEGMAVMTPDGLVGRIIGTGANSARVLLITDINSRIPVLVGDSGDQALLEGTNANRPSLQFLPLNPRFREGDPVMTSGLGGLLPAGLAVGRVDRIEEGRVRVRPAVDWTRLDYVTVLRMPGMPEPDGPLRATALIVPR